MFIKSKGLNLKNKLIGIHPGASWPAKIWLEENFAKIADRLISEGKQVLLFGGPKDRTAVAKVSMFMKNKPVLADNLPLREFMAVLTNCSCFVTNDNGPMHISVAMGVPTLGIFGSSNPAIWFPYKGQKAAYLKKYPECWPCSKDQCKDLRCMKMIKPDEVYKAIKKLCK